MQIDSVEQNIDCISLEDRKIYLLGTAHVSRESVDSVERAVNQFNPDTVAVELCASRLTALKDPNRWRKTDIITVLKEGRAYVLLLQLLLTSFQKKLGAQLNVQPGAEMIKAVELCEAHGKKLVLADHEIKITLKRVWGSLGFLSMIRLFGSLTFGIFGGEKLDEAEIERMKSADALAELLKDFTAALPKVRVPLIDERDQYLAQKIKEAPGKTVLAVVGAAHVPGIKEWLTKDVNLKWLEQLPPPKKLVKLLAWLIPIIVLSLFIYGFLDAGIDKTAQMFGAWFWINAFAGALGSLLALGHPLTILSAFIASPFTSLNPLIAGGWVAGIVEAMIRKPCVADFEALGDDLMTVRGWWKNRVTRILLVVALTNLCGTIGTGLGIWALGRAI